MKSTLMGTAAIAVMSLALASSPAFAARMHHRHMASPSATPAQEQQEEQTTAQLNQAQLNGGTAANTATGATAQTPEAAPQNPAPAQMNSPATSSSGTAPTTNTAPSNKDMAPQTGTSTTGQMNSDTTTPPDATNGEPTTQPKQ
jgi:hypothetical protein